jgi:hypothetical protein
MTREQFDERAKWIRHETIEKFRKLGMDYAIKNRKYNIGDIIEDHYKRIKIRSITVLWSNDGSRLPKEEFRGVRLRKDLMPFGDQSDNVIYSCNIERKIEVKNDQSS